MLPIEPGAADQAPIKWMLCPDQVDALPLLPAV